ESTTGEIKLRSNLYNYDTFTALLNFAYNGTLMISEANVQILMISARYFLMEAVVDECTRFMHDRLNFDNVIPLLDFYRSIDYEKIESVLRFIAMNFVPISGTEEFLTLPFEYLKDIINRDILYVDSEEQVFEAISLWFHKNPDMLHHAPSLLKCIQCGHFSEQFITEIIEKTKWVMDNSECVSIVDNTKKSNEELVITTCSTTGRNYHDPRRLIACFHPFTEYIHVWNPIDHTWTANIDIPKNAHRALSVAVVGTNAYFIQKRTLGLDVY
ncbi:hypothetical protein PENTCL1PPCAC_26233, partial [Pristionchus entomophagus]